MNDSGHVPVLLDEVIAALAIKPDAIIVDATFGRGGHAEEIMKRLGTSGRLLAMDRDPAAIEAGQRRFHDDARVVLEQAPFSLLQNLCERHRVSGRVSGIVFDLGVSSPQLNDAQRGFSFRADGPLDMRMDPTRGPSAADWINSAPESEIERVLREYGEERFARRIARAIATHRAERPLVTTGELQQLVADAIPRRERGKDPATRTFQAIRIHINRELDELAAVLPQAVRVLAPGGRLAVISFHSLEDRLVKRFLRAQSTGPVLPPKLPVRHKTIPVPLKLVGRAQQASAAEVQRNPRARSAVLRVAERTEVAYA